MVYVLITQTFFVVTHIINIDTRRGDHLNAHLADTLTCGGHLIYKSVFLYLPDEFGTNSPISEGRKAYMAGYSNQEAGVRFR